MSHLSLWAPWFIVGVLVTVMLIRERSAIHARKVLAEVSIVVGA
jgi:hypothetical protein